LDIFNKDGANWVEHCMKGDQKRRHLRKTGLDGITEIIKHCDSSRKDGQIRAQWRMKIKQALN